jgi:hypothetical protein
MGTLSSELAQHVERLMPHPRIYADANVPSGLVAHMRARLQWDVLFVLEEDDLRRARDVKHYQLAQQLRRTLVTMDRDYLDDRRFPPEASGGVLVINAPNERELTALVDRIDRHLFRRADGVPGSSSIDPDTDDFFAAPLAGRKLQLNTEWGRDDGRQ